MRIHIFRKGLFPPLKVLRQVQTLVFLLYITKLKVKSEGFEI